MGAIFIGTSGFSYREWMGRFYPLGLKNKDLLSFYASKFNAVEINNTFYRLPAAKTLESWLTIVGPEFRFAVKANQQITHRKDFGIPGGEFEHFLTTIETLNERLGPVLFQFPPTFGRKEKMMGFLETLRPLLARHHRVVPVIELRNKNLLSPDVLENLLEQGMNICLNDAHLAMEEWPAPTNIVYLRLRNGPYERNYLERIGNQIVNWAEKGRECYVFFKHELAAPELACEMKTVLVPNRSQLVLSH